MDKKKQRSLNIWLKQQSKLAKRWLMLAVGLGVLSSVFLLAQAALLASILHQLIIEHVDKHELIPYFVGLAVTIADDPLSCVAIGTGHALEERKALRNVLVGMY